MRCVVTIGPLVLAAVTACSPPVPERDAAPLFPSDAPPADHRDVTTAADTATDGDDAAMDAGADAVDDTGPMDAPTDSQGDSRAPDAAGTAAPLVYVGTGDGNLTTYSFDRASGRLTMASRVAAGNFPSYGAFAPDGRHLYTTLEGSSRLAAFELDTTTGAATLLGTVAATGMGPTFISLDHAGHFALAADYTSGGVGVYPVLPSGALGTAVRNYATGMQSHSILTSADDRFAYVCNKATDAISQFRFDAASGALNPSTPATFSTADGAGPRHIALHPAGTFAFVMNENDCNVVAYRINASSGTLSMLQTISTLAAGVSTTGNTGAEIFLGPDARFVYASTRGSATNTITVFSLDAASGHLTFVQRIGSGGSTPRDFAIDGPGNVLLVANQDSDNVVAFSIDPASGRLTQRMVNGVGHGAYWVGVLQR